MLYISKNLSQISKYRFPKPVKNVLIYNKTTQFQRELAKSPQGELDDFYYRKLENIKNADKEHQIHLAELYKSLEDNGIHKQNIKQVETRQNGWDLFASKAKNFSPDLVISIGGDGTFLRASHLLHPRYNTQKVPIIGINSNPTRSEGRLCQTTTKSISQMINTLLTPSSTLDCIKRQRIKIILKSRDIQVFNMYDFYSDLPSEDQLLLDPAADCPRQSRSIDDPKESYEMALPIMALNDVYLGERASSMVTNLDVEYKSPPHSLSDGEAWERHKLQKNSGIVVCTGSGSTAWSKSINYICSETIKTIFSHLKKDQDYDGSLDRLNDLDYQKICDVINSTRTVFDPSDRYLGVTFREPINNKISHCGTSNFIRIGCLKSKSKLHNGMLCIDGSTFHTFPRGSIVYLNADSTYAISCLQV